MNSLNIFYNDVLYFSSIKDIPVLEIQGKDIIYRSSLINHTPQFVRKNFCTQGGMKEKELVNTHEKAETPSHTKKARAPNKFFRDPWRHRGDAENTLTLYQF